MSEVKKTSKADWTAPLILGILSFLMARGVKYLQSKVEDNNIMMESSTATSIGNNKRPSWLNTTIHDNFMQIDDPLLTKLQNKDEWTRCKKQRTPIFWDGKSDPKNMWEELTLRMWSSRPEFQEAVGFEYWCQIIKEDADLFWHIDKDEEAVKYYDEIVTPLLGSVFYGFNHDGKFKGGKLILVDAQFDENPEFKRRNEMKEIEAKFNRLIYFNASLWHRVSSVTGGERYTFAVNALTQIPRRITHKHKIELMRKKSL